MVADAAPPVEPPEPLPHWWLPDTRSILAIVTVGCVFAAAFIHVDQGVFTAILPLATIVLGWYFGSSKGSDDKSTAISRQLDKK
jgi:hypothetical protein